MPFPSFSGRCLSSLSYKSGKMTSRVQILKRDTNQAEGLAAYAKSFIHDENQIDGAVKKKVSLFHADAILCGLSALARRTAAPSILRHEALTYPFANGARLFGRTEYVHPEKAVAANCSAVREWDSNGTVFGFDPNDPTHQAGEFGHNDFYPVVIAACQSNPKISGKEAMRGLICIDEIRGRLAEVFSLKSYKIDHVVHGAIASAAVYGALLGASIGEIENAIGLAVAHYIPFRAIRHGKQLSDSKGASAALSAETAVLSVRRAMQGFNGPKDIFRNPEAIFCLNEPQPPGVSPFDLRLALEGSDFALMGMHFKLGLYEHQSAGAIEGLIRLLTKEPSILEKHSQIQKIIIKAYDVAFKIIGDPAKRNPTSRQSADHSMVYIISTLLRKAIELQKLPGEMDEAWKSLILKPSDYDLKSINNSLTRKLMEKIEFELGGPEFDKAYPKGIPTSIAVHMSDNTSYCSGMIMYPAGHARNTTADLQGLLDNKFEMLGRLVAEPSQVKAFIQKLDSIENCTNKELQDLYVFEGLEKTDEILGFNDA